MKKKLKVLVQHLLISVLGFSNYLYSIALYRIVTFRFNRKQNDFKYFVSLIPDSGHILDIGANIGYTTYYLSRKKKNAIIHSFEPIPHNFEILKKVVRIFKLTNTRLYNIGLGESANTLDMIMPIINGIKKHARCQVFDQDSIYTDGVKFKIEIDKLDNIAFFNNPNNKVSAIKIDVEDYEYYVFKGGIELIKKHQPIIFCEIWTSSEKKYKVIELFNSLNYTIKIYSYSGLVDFDRSIHLNGNLVLIPSQNDLLKRFHSERKQALATT